MSYFDAVLRKFNEVLRFGNDRQKIGGIMRVMEQNIPLADFQRAQTLENLCYYGPDHDLTDDLIKIINELINKQKRLREVEPLREICMSGEAEYQDFHNLMQCLDMEDLKDFGLDVLLKMPLPIARIYQFQIPLKMRTMLMCDSTQQFCEDVWNKCLQIEKMYTRSTTTSHYEGSSSEGEEIVVVKQEIQDSP